MVTHHVAFEHTIEYRLCVEYSYIVEYCIFNRQVAFHMTRDNFILAIGIDKYEHPTYPRLNNARGDAERFIKILQQRYGYKLVCAPLYDEDATRKNIFDTLHGVFNSVGPEDNLIIYYAGHGNIDPRTKKGYWVPIDGNTPSSVLYNYEIVELIKEIEARHILLISDSCFAGTFFEVDRSGGGPLAHEELDALNSRWVFTSTGLNTVLDGPQGKGTLFNRMLCDFLAKNEQPTVSAEDIFQAVIKAVKQNLPGQDPRAQNLKIEAHAGGQLILRLKTSLLEKVSSRGITSVKPSFFGDTAVSIKYIARQVSFYEHQRDQLIYFFEPDRGKTTLFDALNKHSKIALLGSAGSGKSIELQNLARLLSNNNTAFIPIYKRFNTYTGQDLEKFLPPGWDQVEPELIVLLLDGIDEIQDNFFLIAVNKLVEFCNKYNEIKIVVSCRTNFYELPTKRFSGTIEGFSVYQLNDISFSEIQKYAEEVTKIKGVEFLQVIHQASLLDLVHKPYFLRLLLSHYVTHKSFPVNRSEILDEALNLIHENDRQHFNSKGVSINKYELFEKIEKIAFVMEVMGKNYISDQELHQLFPLDTDYEKCKYLPAFKRDESREQWSFEHNNVQEYLASRVLAKQSFEKLIDIVSTTTGDLKKIKTPWINTVSFLVSIGNQDLISQLVDWIIANDHEVIVRFEPDRIPIKKRSEIFRSIFDYYNGKQIWLSSNKFSDNDLARFAALPETVEYILQHIQSPISSRITILNAIHVLDNFEHQLLYPYKDTIKKALLLLMVDSRLRKDDLYSIFGAISRLPIADDETVRDLVSRFRKSKNQYIRAGLYKLLLHSNILDENVDILIEGLDLSKIKDALNDRMAVNLMDESFQLTSALKSIKQPNALKALLRFMTEEKSTGMYRSDYEEVITAIVENCINACLMDTTIYKYVEDYYISSPRLYHSESLQLLLPFFERTNTTWDLFLSIWKRVEVNKYDTQELITPLFCSQHLIKFLAGYEAGEFIDEDIFNLHQMFLWQDESPFILETITKLEAAARNHAYPLERPISKNTIEATRARLQYSFDLLFEPEKLFVEIGKIVKIIGKEEISQRDAFIFRSEHNLYLPAAALDLLRDLTFRDQTITENGIREFILDPVIFPQYQIQEIIQDLQRYQDKYLLATPIQCLFITKWCMENPKDLDKRWFFLHRLKLTLPEPLILELTKFFDFAEETNMEQSGTIEKLYPYVSKEKLVERVSSNIHNEELKTLVWISNAAFAIRNRLSGLYAPIIDYLERIHEDEYKLQQLLEFWFNITGDTARLRLFIERIKVEALLWKAISLLRRSGQEYEFLREQLKITMNNTGRSSSDRLQASNYLMEMNEMDGLKFAHDYLLERKDPSMDFRFSLGSISQFTNPRGLKYLTNLLLLAKQPEFQKDHFNSLESVITDSLYRMGIVSDENFKSVQQTIKAFIKENEQIIENINFLEFLISRIEEQLNRQKSQNYTIEQAIVEWKKSQP